MVEQHSVTNLHTISHEIARLVIAHAVPASRFRRQLFKSLIEKAPGSDLSNQYPSVLRARAIYSLSSHDWFHSFLHKVMERT